VRLGRTLVDLDGLLDQHGRGRRLDDEGEALVREAVITTGSGRPGSTPWVWALNALQNSMMFRPRWPSAGPMGATDWPCLPELAA
jgi:hypothetical protein